jgi:catechol 2,3-dioxygenase-like lactoylglutathione lyase family enzyme
MIGYVTLGTNDLPRAAAFYDALCAEVGAQRTMDFGDRGIAWGRSMAEPMLCLMRPFDGEPATVGNGTMVAVQVADRAAVERAHAKALELGGRDEGAPGLRGDTFFAAYFRDLDGNKLAAFCIES